MTPKSRERASDSRQSVDGTGTPWYRRLTGVLVVTGYACLTAAGVLVSMGVGGIIGPAHAVPAYIYLYAGIGVSGYIFTTLITDFDQTVSELLRVGIRVPAAFPLGLGVYLLASLVGIDADPNSRAVAGLSFLAGLYANMTFKRLGALADRLYPSRENSGSGEN